MGGGPSVPSQDVPWAECIYAKHGPSQLTEVFSIRV